MASPAIGRSSGLSALNQTLLGLGGLIAAYFIYSYVFPYANWSEAGYGFYWQFRTPLAFHITGGMVALLAGIFQLWSGLNRTRMGTHPVTGRIYAGGVFIGSLGAIMLSLTTGTFGLTFGTALFCLEVIWLLSTGLAIRAVRKRKVILHQQWMTRSYILTFAFVTFRIITDYVPYGDWWGLDQEQVSNATIWAVWVLPWIAYEIYLSVQQLARTK